MTGGRLFRLWFWFFDVLFEHSEGHKKSSVCTVCSKPLHCPSTFPNQGLFPYSVLFSGGAKKYTGLLNGPPQQQPQSPMKALMGITAILLPKSMRAQNVVDGIPWLGQIMKFYVAPYSLHLSYLTLSYTMPNCQWCSHVSTPTLLLIFGITATLETEKCVTRVHCVNAYHQMHRKTFLSLKRHKS